MPPPYLDALFRQAIASPEIVALSIATRPDCLGPEVLALFAAPQSNQTRLGGAGTANHTSDSARYIRRGYRAAGL